MRPFTQWTGVAAPLPSNDIDTDKIIPARFMKTIRRDGLRTGLFYELAHTPQGERDTQFILNRVPFDRASILITGHNFGCGSSREHAVWALADFGVRCVIARSFADIFQQNAVNNGLLPVILGPDPWEQLVKAADTARGLTVTVNLLNETIMPADGKPVRFTIETVHRELLLHGFDQISQTLARQTEIDAWEQRSKRLTSAIGKDWQASRRFRA